MLRIAVFILMICVMASAATIDEIKKRGYLNIAVFSDRPPFSYVDEDDEFHGFDTLIARAFAKELFGSEDKVRFIQVLAADRADILAKGGADIVLASYSISEQRKQFVDFATPYMKSAVGVVSSTKKPIKNLAALRDKRLIVIKSTISANYFLRNYPEMNQISFMTFADAYNAFLEGKGDALTDDTTNLIYWTNLHRGFEMGIKHLGDDIPIAPAVAKGNADLLEWVNKAIDKLQKEGFILNAYNQTLRQHYGKETDPYSIIY